MVVVISHLSAGRISCLVLSTAAYSPQEKGKGGPPSDFSSFRREGSYMQVFQSNLSLCTPTNFFSVCLFFCCSLWREMDICSTSEIWYKNMQGYVYGHYLFYERSSRKTVSFLEQIMLKNKYPSTFLSQIETIVFIMLQIFFTTHAVLKIGDYSVM